MFDTNSHYFVLENYIPILKQFKGNDKRDCGRKKYDVCKSRGPAVPLVLAGDWHGPAAAAAAAAGTVV